MLIIVGFGPELKYRKFGVGGYFLLLEKSFRVGRVTGNIHIILLWPNTYAALTICTSGLVLAHAKGHFRQEIDNFIMNSA